jgi:hypothetical protein
MIFAFPQMRSNSDAALHMHAPPSVAMDTGVRLPRGEIPSSEETLPLLQNQSIVVQQLEAENKFCRVGAKCAIFTARCDFLPLAFRMSYSH